MEKNTKRRRSPAVKAAPAPVEPTPVEPVKPAPVEPTTPKRKRTKPAIAAAPTSKPKPPAPATAKPKTRTRKSRSLAVKAHASDLRSPREIAIDICEKILTEGDNWNDDLYGERRPVMMITRHREHISPTSHERRIISPLILPKPTTSSIIRQTVEALPHTEAGMIDFDEIKRMASETKPFNPTDNSLTRRVTIIAAVIVGMIVLGTISMNIIPSGPPAFIKDVINQAAKTNSAIAGTKRIQAPGQP